MAVAEPDSDRSCVVIYDAQCRLCVNAKEGIERLATGLPASKVRFVPYQTDEAARYLGEEYRQGTPDVAFLVQPDGRIQRGLEAFLPLLPGLPGGKVLAALFRIPFLKPFAHSAYRLVARHRYRWFGAVPR